MGQPPPPGPYGPSTGPSVYVPPPRSPRRTITIVVLIIWGPLVAGGGFFVLLCGGLGYVMTGTADTGAGAMLVVGLIVTILGVVMTLASLLTWSRD